MGLAEHSSVIDNIAERHRPKRVVEVGLKYSTTTLISIFSRYGLTEYIGIDPDIRYQCPPNLSHYFVPVTGFSLEELPKLGKLDLVMLDGDHTYYTVLKELELLHSILSPGSVILLHDVEDPWSRKDHYYNVDRIPPEFVDGEKQGVLTALEDFLKVYSQSYSELEIFSGNNGLGYLVKK